jgi:hypothetical protein
MNNGLRYVPMINGVVHSWANLVVAITGVPVTGIKKISYKDEQEIEEVYGAGQDPVGRGYGRIKCTGSITLERGEVEALRAASPTGRLQDIPPFPITSQFLPVNGQKIVTHRLLNVQFKNDGVEVSEGDTSNYTEFELAIGKILWK